MNSNEPNKRDDIYGSDMQNGLYDIYGPGTQNAGDANNANNINNANNTNNVYAAHNSQNANDTLNAFDDYGENGARQSVGEASAEVISAVKLTARQRQKIEIRLIRMLKRHVKLKFTVDPALLGGVRIVANNTVIDDSIKRKLFDMKSIVTKGVFQSD